MRTSAVCSAICSICLASCGAPNAVPPKTASGTVASSASAASISSVTSKSLSSETSSVSTASRDEDIAFLRSLIIEANTAADAMTPLSATLPDEAREQVEHAIEGMRAQIETLTLFLEAAQERDLTEEERSVMTEQVAILLEGIDAFASMTDMLSQTAPTDPQAE